MITFITGGARSGKSSFAEGLYKGKEDVVYIATAIVTDEEMEDRVKMHQDSRPAEWRTFEGFRDIDKAVGSEENYLLDCITVLTSNIMFEKTKDLKRIDIETQKQVEDEILQEINKLIQKIRDKDKNLVLVSNEVGSSLVPEHHISRVFRDIQGRINQKVAEISDSAYLVVAGLPVKLK